MLVFSQSLESLAVLEEVLKQCPSPRAILAEHQRASGGGSSSGGGGGGEGAAVGWQRGLDYLRFDGTHDADERDVMIAHFNQPALKLRLFLISTRAGGQGLNLAAASRVIVFDASWNPSNDTQAVFRAYRYGQTRPVFVYRLIAEGFEQCLYRQQVVKLQLAGRVLDEQTHDAQFSQDELKNLWRPIAHVPAPPPGHFSHAISALPATSWLGPIASGPCASFLANVEDHDKRLEGTPSRGSRNLPLTFH